MNLKNIKTWISLIGLILILCTISWLVVLNKNLNRDYETAMTNNKAYLSQLDNDKSQSIVFQASIDQLSYFNDSITRKLLETKNELGIKDKQIKELSYLSSNFSRTDSIYVTDTIFKDVDINIDTTIGDKWLYTHILLQYPNKIIVDPHALSEKTVILYAKKETIEAPKKFFLLRWFQKKHTVIHAIVNEANPYIETEQNTFYQIID